MDGILIYKNKNSVYFFIFLILTLSSGQLLLIIQQPGYFFISYFFACELGIKCDRNWSRDGETWPRDSKNRFNIKMLDEEWWKPLSFLKFNFRQFLFEAFFDIISTFDSVQPRSESTLPFQYSIFIIGKCSTVYTAGLEGSQQR